jgi:hypothetical protein
MIRILAPTVALALMLPCLGAAALERIKKRLPTAAGAEPIASDMAKNDSLLQRGDIIATDRGFLLYRGLAPDGVSGDFVAVPNPLSANKPSSGLGR